MNVTTSQCMIIKIGSSLLIDEKQRCLNTPWLTSLIDDIADLVKQNIKIILVSSGAVAHGKLILGLTNKTLSLDSKQAAAAVGQIQLIQTYQNLFNKRGIKTAQILLNLDDSENRQRYLNIRNTLKRLLKMQIIPIINENDTVGTAEIRYGDNDRLAARVAQMIDADTLILLSDVDGFYTNDPSTSHKAELIPVIKKLTPEIFSMAKESVKNYGSGGMKTKLAAAKIAMSSGCRMLIMAGQPMHPIRHFITTNRGTWFHSNNTPKNAKKIWLSEHLKPQGTVIVDNGAASALLNGASLLPVGITDIVGHFQKGAAVRIITNDKVEIARGLINYSNQEVYAIKGKSSKAIKTILNYAGCDEVIHRDNLVLINHER